MVAWTLYWAEQVLCPHVKCVRNRNKLSKWSLSSKHHFQSVPEKEFWWTSVSINTTITWWFQIMWLAGYVSAVVAKPIAVYSHSCIFFLLNWLPGVLPHLFSLVIWTHPTSMEASCHIWCLIGAAPTPPRPITFHLQLQSLRLNTPLELWLYTLLTISRRSA